jgi:hypothetical protein
MQLRSLTIAIITGIFALFIVGTNAYGWIAAHRSMLLLNRDRPQPPAQPSLCQKHRQQQSRSWPIWMNW